MNIYKFANLAGVSSATISRAFSRKGRISPKTRKRILALSRKLDYTPNIHAKRLANLRSNTVAIMFIHENKEDHLDYFSMELSLSLIKAASARGYSTQIEIPSREKYCLERLDELIMGKAVDASILIGGEYSPSAKNKFKIAINCISILSRGTKPPFSIKADCIYIDYGNGINKAVESLSAAGKVKPGIIRGLNDDYKINLIRKAFLKNGIDFDQSLVFEGKGDFKHSWQAAEKLLSNGVDSLICCTDIMALAAIQAAVTNKKVIPDDIAIIGMDNLDFTSYVTPSLSTVSFPMDKVSKAVFNILPPTSRNSSSSTSTYYKHEPPKKIIPTEFIRRQSSP